MVLKQYYVGCLAHASYLLGDEASSTAIIVDPQRDIHQYLVDAEKFGLEIRHVFLTHFHADFVAGHLDLRDHCGATIRLGARAKAEYAFVAMKDGDTLEFPGLRVQVLETPGHTIESISILVFDLEKDPAKPHAVHTGDTLFIGDVGRCLLVRESAKSCHEERWTSSTKQRVPNTSFPAKRAVIEFWSVLFYSDDSWNASTYNFLQTEE